MSRKSKLSDGSACFKKLLAPLISAEFEKTFYRKKYRHFQALDSRRFDSIFSSAAFEQLVAAGIPSSQTFAFDKARIQLSASDHCIDQQGELRLDPRKVKKLLESNGSISVKSLEKSHPALRILALAAEKWSGSQKAFINLYLTPKGGQTFGWHQDGHDVFVMQIEGQKIWEIYEPHYRVPFSPVNPLEYIEQKLTQKKSQLIERVVLKKGDLLYLPACFPHEVKCGLEFGSLHLTIALIPYQRRLLLKHAMEMSLRELTTDLEFREPLFVGPDGALSIEHQKELKRLLNKIVRGVRWETLLPLKENSVKKMKRSKK